MNQIRFKPYLFYVFGITMLLFVLNKFVLRPLIIEYEISGIVLIITNSVPNLFEAIIGTLNIAGILSLIRFKFFRSKAFFKDSYLYSASSILAATYVITQELTIHNLGGRNIYDPYDLIASIIGLIGTYIMMMSYGMLVDSNIIEES